jgi:hypothetical protein
VEIDQASGRLHVAVGARSTAPPAVVWRLLADARAWSRWAPIRHSRLEREGDPAPDGVGAIRCFGTGPVNSREQVVVFEPPHRLAYVLLQGMPVRRYRSDVVLAPDGAGTAISWRSTFDPRWPGTGPLLRGFLIGVLGSFARRLARAAAREVSAPTDGGV